jgi:aspartate kinase
VNNNIIVAKFGGSSLADAEQFKKVRSIVMSDPRRKYVIPSAPGKRNKGDYKITDLLYLCHAHVRELIAFDDVFNIISKRYTEIAKELKIDIDIKSYLDDIKQKIESGASADYVASRGEYLNGLLLSNYLNYEFIDAAEIVFFNKAGYFDSEKTQKVMSSRLLKSEHAVIPGFYGSLPNGEIKTFSRGGSDISGAIIARGADAYLYENWTDVSGFLMADPRIVENPKTIEKITYRELRELAYMGATVLHEDSIFPVRKAGIPINIKNTNSPDDPGTMIISQVEKTDSTISHTDTITGIAGKKDFTVIAIEKNLMNTEIGFGRKLLSILETNRVSFEHIPTGIDTMSLVISDNDLDGKLDVLLEEIERECKPDSIQVHPDMALIATVGLGMAKNKGVAAKVFGALAEAEINIRMIDQGSSEINIIVGVENKDFENAVKAIYNKFKN